MLEILFCEPPPDRKPALTIDPPPPGIFEYIPRSPISRRDMQRRAAIPASGCFDERGTYFCPVRDRSQKLRWIEEMLQDIDTDQEIGFLDGSFLD